jgi:hypothetical protein
MSSSIVLTTLLHPVHALERTRSSAALLGSRRAAQDVGAQTRPGGLVRATILRACMIAMQTRTTATVGGNLQTNHASKRNRNVTVHRRPIRSTQAALNTVHTTANQASEVMPLQSVRYRAHRLKKNAGRRSTTRVVWLIGRKLQQRHVQTQALRVLATLVNTRAPKHLPCLQHSGVLILGVNPEIGSAHSIAELPWYAGTMITIPMALTSWIPGDGPSRNNRVLLRVQLNALATPRTNCIVKWAQHPTLTTSAGPSKSTAARAQKIVKEMGNRAVINRVSQLLATGHIQWIKYVWKLEPHSHAVATTPRDVEPKGVWTLIAFGIKILSVALQLARINTAGWTRTTAMDCGCPWTSNVSTREKVAHVPQATLRARTVDGIGASLIRGPAL